MRVAELFKETGCYLVCLCMFSAVLVSVPVEAGGRNAVQPRIAGENLGRWEKMSESQKEHFRMLQKHYKAMPAKEQELLTRRLETFNKLPLRMQHIILKNGKRLAALSKDDRQSFYRLVARYKKLQDSGKAQVRRAFKKIKKMPKEKQLQLFYLLLEENKKTTPAIKQLIWKFLEQGGQLSPEETEPPPKELLQEVSSKES